jgi:hypothetical protein
MQNGLLFVSPASAPPGINLPTGMPTESPQALPPNIVLAEIRQRVPLAGDDAGLSL